MDAVRKLISPRLRGQVAGPHPDPDLLAALAENTLSPQIRQGLLNHLSTCDDCRDTLYLAMPETDTQQVLRAPREPRLAIRWATLAASVVVLGSVLVSNRGAFTRHAVSVPAPAMETSGQKQQIAEFKAPAEIDRIAQAPAIEARVRPPVKHMTAKPKASMQFDQSGEVRLAMPESATRADEAAPARANLAKALDARAKKDSSSCTWGLSSNGQVQRSLDSGRTWQIVPIANGGSFLVISSVGDDVWVGGRAGALYHSADSGQSWSKSELAASGDIVQVHFSDPQHGALITANGEVWSTSDGGQSWRLK